MARFETWFDTDLKKINPVIALNGRLFYNDNGGNLFGVHVFDDGVPVESLSGTCKGWVMLENDQTLPVNGTVSGGDAYIILPEAAYAFPGKIIITIKLLSGDDVTTLISCVGYVFQTATDVVIDPEDIIPSWDDVLAKLAQLDEAIADAESVVSGLPTKADKADTVLDTTLSRGRRENTMVGEASFVFGTDLSATKDNAHAIGRSNSATGAQASVEGSSNSASAANAHVEGYGNVGSGADCHVENRQNTGSGNFSHVSGIGNKAKHQSQFVFGEYNQEDPSEASTSERGTYVEIVGNGTDGQHRSNARTLDWDGNEELAGGLKIAGTFSRGRKANTTVATGSFAFGIGVEASGSYSHAEGTNTNATGTCSHAEGGGSTASDAYAHAEGGSTTASSSYAHAEGSNTTASGTFSHSEGSLTTASGNSSHAEGNSSTASGYASHTEGMQTTASGSYSHADGDNTIANHKSQHVFGAYNVADPNTYGASSPGNYIEIVGNGLGDEYRSNARTLDWNGNETLAGSLTLGKGTENEVTITAAQLTALLALIS